MKKVLLFAVVFSCSMWANAQRVTWATEAGVICNTKNWVWRMLASIHSFRDICRL